MITFSILGDEVLGGFLFNNNNENEKKNVVFIGFEYDLFGF